MQTFPKIAKIARRADSDLTYTLQASKQPEAISSNKTVQQA